MRVQQYFLTGAWVLLLSVYGRSTYAAEQITFLMADGASEPYQIVSKQPQKTPHSGILTDLLTATLADSDIKIIPVVRPYKRIRLELLAQRYDNWVSYGSPSWLDERVLALGDYSEIPILESHYALTALAEFGRPELGHVRAKKVIVIHGYNYHPGFYDWAAVNDIQLVYAPSHRHALAMLKQYRADYYMAEALRVRWQARDSGVPLAELHIMDFSRIVPPSVVYLLFDKRLPVSVREKINFGLVDMQRSGALLALIKRYQ